jgi:hypothetical protein
MLGALHCELPSTKETRFNSYASILSNIEIG